MRRPDFVDIDENAKASLETDLYFDAMGNSGWTVSALGICLFYSPLPSNSHATRACDGEWSMLKRNYYSSINSPTFLRILAVALMMSSISSSVPSKTF